MVPGIADEAVRSVHAPFTYHAVPVWHAFTPIASHEGNATRMGGEEHE